MLLTVDMGNTNITLGVFEGESLLFESRIATDMSKMRDQYAVELSDILRLYHVDVKSLEGAIVSSVVPSLDQSLKEAIFMVTGLRPLFVGPGLKTGMNILIDNPAQLGADILVGAVAAANTYGTPCIIWDLGTATTVSAVSATGDFLGVSIMAGVHTSLEALVSKTSLLPNIRLEAPVKVIGKNTIHSMQSGIVYSTAAMVDGMTERVKKELSHSAKVVMTGGFGKVIAPYCETNAIYDDKLILNGLRFLYEKNK